MHATQIVAYIYNADIYGAYECDCAYDLSVRLFRDAGGKVEGLLTESNLACAAMYLGIDRMDEATYDSDDFPKVVFASQVEDAETCGECGQSLV